MKYNVGGRYLYLKVVLCFIGGLFAVMHAQADSWRVFLYVDRLEMRSITDLMNACIPEGIEMCIQVRSYNNRGLRYRITSDKFSAEREVGLTGDATQDFINAASWGFTCSRADHTMLILSDSDSDADHDMFFGWQAESLRTIQETVLQGSELDIIACDMSKSVVLEEAYHVAPYARYLVGSQSCIQNLISALNQENNVPAAVAPSMVSAGDTYAALDLAGVESVIQALNSLASLVMALPDRAALLAKAREQAPRWYQDFAYTDLVAFCDAIEHTLRASDTQDISRILYGSIYEAVSKVRRAVKAIALARCAECTEKNDTGTCAIYCPNQHIASRYYKTLFARECKWILLLQVVVGNGGALQDGKVKDKESCVHAISF